MSALVAELPRAQSKPCIWCPRPSTIVNRYSIPANSYEPARHARDFICADCVTHAEEVGRRHGMESDRYEPLILATVGDELWISLECWTRQLGEQVRIMAEAVVDETRCSVCGAAIHPDVCHCGTLVSEHTIADNHGPVAMECPCQAVRP